MSVATIARQPSESSFATAGSGDVERTDNALSVHANGDRDRRVSSSSSSGSASGSNGGSNSGGILANAHEAPKRSAKAESGIRSALKAAFIPQQPGKQMRTNGKPLGKTFHRKEPLPQTHQGAEVLKIDPRGPNAPCGDGVVLASNGRGDEAEGEATPTQPISPTSPNSSTGNSWVGGSSANGSSLTIPSSAGPRSRSGTTSTVFSEMSEMSTDSSNTSGTNSCSIKFAPLPTSGRLKRANSITIGVAARSQLLHSQGAGRQMYNNGQSWQQPSYQQQPHRYQPPTVDISRYSGAQQRQNSADAGESRRKSASKAGDRAQRGSSASRESEGETSQDAAVTPAAAKGKEYPTVFEEEEHAEGAGEKTPKRSQSPTHLTPAAEKESKRNGILRRVSTGAFTGQASFMSVEERRKRGDRESPSRSSEREDEATKFIEMLGSTGAGREAFHGADRMMRRKPDASEKSVDVVAVDGAAESADNPARNDGGEEGDDNDDDETREAERMADEALKSHNEKANRAGGIEKMEKKRLPFLK